MTNTNVTLFPNKLKKYLEKIKSVNISMSIDGVNETNDYIRYKSNWSTTLNIVDKWKEFASINDNIMLTTATCVHAYNVHQIDEILTWSSNNDFTNYNNIISGPKYLKLEALPLGYVEYVIDKIKHHPEVEGIVNYLNNMQHDSQLQDQLKNFTKSMDEITGLDLKDYNPVLAEYLKMDD